MFPQGIFKGSRFRGKPEKDQTINFNTLGLFVMQTIAMWEESSKLPEMRDVRFDVAIEILRNTYPVSQWTGCACDETGPCKAHGKPTPPAPIAAQTEKFGPAQMGYDKFSPTEQVDAARWGATLNDGTLEWVPRWEAEEKLRAASLKQETQPPSNLPIKEGIYIDVDD